MLEQDQVSVIVECQMPVAPQIGVVTDHTSGYAETWRGSMFSQSQSVNGPKDAVPLGTVYTDRYGDPIVEKDLPLFQMPSSREGEVELGSTAQHKSLEDKKPRKVSFPRLLHSLLNEETKPGKYCSVSWEPNGRAFTIFDRGIFASEVMPRYESYSLVY